MSNREEDVLGNRDYRDCFGLLHWCDLVALNEDGQDSGSKVHYTVTDLFLIPVPYEGDSPMNTITYDKLKTNLNVWIEDES